jgi:hypothetical protein
VKIKSGPVFDKGSFAGTPVCDSLFGWLWFLILPQLTLQQIVGQNFVDNRFCHEIVISKNKYY